ncbi:MAG: SEL1-like repeat protein [Acidobacteria bacterium]|nr:SEL1-like repeat protein [Acidobacteriota bacterium]
MAQHSLGMMHSFGWGVGQDDTEAMRWYRLAAEQGHAPSRAALGQSR